MTSHYDRDNRGKGKPPAPNKWVRDAPPRLPEEDNRDLIKDNRLTLIGRVLNLDIQKPKAVASFLPQLWGLKGRIETRDLGREKFSFKFERKEDLYTVLDKAPFHYKHWMLVIQRWEPVISDAFPRIIPLWIKIHDLPLHCWKYKTLKAIGDEIGKFIECDVKEGRIIVEVNALKLLLMKKLFTFPTKEEATLEFEYEILEKHCFSCFSLDHEQKDCNIPSDNLPQLESISEKNTRQKIETFKQKHELNRVKRTSPPPLPPPSPCRKSKSPPPPPRRKRSVSPPHKSSRYSPPRGRQRTQYQQAQNRRYSRSPFPRRYSNWRNRSYGESNHRFQESYYRPVEGRTRERDYHPRNYHHYQHYTHTKERNSGSNYEQRRDQPPKASKPENYHQTKDAHYKEREKWVNSDRRTDIQLPQVLSRLSDPLEKKKRPALEGLSLQDDPVGKTLLSRKKVQTNMKGNKDKSVGSSSRTLTENCMIPERVIRKQVRAEMSSKATIDDTPQRLIRGSKEAANLLVKHKK